MYRKLILSLLPMAFAMSLSAQQAMRLSDAIDYALANHTEVRIANLNVTDAEWRYKENRALGYPHLSIGMNYQHFLQQPAIPAEALGFEGAEPGQKITFALQNNLNGKIELNQLLFNNTYFTGLRAVKLYREYVQLELNSVKEKVRNNVRDAYLPALALTRSVEVLDSNILNQEKLFTETRAIYTAGFAEQLDVDRIELILSTLKTERENFLRQKSTAIDVLKYTMNMPVSTDVTLSDDLEGLLDQYASIDPDEKLDYMNRPDYITILKSQELNEVQVDFYKKDWLPRVSMFASYDPTFQGNKELFWIPSAIAGVSVQMNIYDGGYALAKKERAIIDALKVEEQKKFLLEGYDLAIENARDQYRSAKQNLDEIERNLALAQRIRLAAESKFKAGIGSSFEVTQAQSGFFQAQGNLVNAQFDLLKSIIAINRALGKT
ncbi:MAG: TolC family protein [Chitinophagales bacterium]